MYFFYSEQSCAHLFSLCLLCAVLQAPCFSGVYTAAAKREIFCISSVVAAAEAKPSVSLGGKKSRIEEIQL